MAALRLLNERSSLVRRTGAESKRMRERISHAMGQLEAAMAGSVENRSPAARLSAVVG
jgi:hypothetical protein